MDKNDDSRLAEFCQLKREIRGSTQHLVVGIDIAKERHHAFFGTPSGKTLLHRLVFDNSKEGFEKLCFQTDILQTQHCLAKVVFGMEPTADYHKPLGEYLNELPRSKLRGIKALSEPIEEHELTSMYLMIRSALLFYVLPDNPLVAVLPDGVRIIAACPELSSPKHLFHLSVSAEYLPGSDALDDLDNRLRGHDGYALDEEVYMIFIGADLHEMDLVSFRNSHADLFQGVFHCFGKYLPPVFCRAHYMVEEERLVVSLEDMFAHSSILLHSTDRSDVYGKGIRAA